MKRPRRIPLPQAALAFLALFGALSLPLLAAQAPEPQQPAIANDPLFQQPYTDIDEWRDKPVRHRYVHGGFRGTDARFSFYFPPKEHYQGRFFQHVTPAPSSENLRQETKGEEDFISFSAASGGYFIETNEGGPSAMAQGQGIAGYRVNAASAEYSRVLAAQMYGGKRPFGYVFGGSGGGFKSTSGFENTTTWDGAVPYVIGSPVAIPNVFTVRIQALRILKDKFPSIMDAIEPGGSGDMYQGLNQEEREVLREVTRMGFPPKGWFNYKTVGTGAFPILFPLLRALDPQYFRDFWTVPGYQGSNPPESLVRARIQHKTRIKSVLRAAGTENIKAMGGVDTAWKQMQGEAAVAFQLESVPAGGADGAFLIAKSGAAAGKELAVRRVAGDIVAIGTNPGANDAATLEAFRAGDEVMVDNSDYLAAQTLHRHQVPTRDFYVFDQFRGPDGNPLFPQRKMEIGPMITAGGAGSLQSGKFRGKMIVVASMMDQDAYPWQADWYRSKVKAALGDHLDDSFRLWFTENAIHGDATSQEDPTHTVSYLGVLHQALRDVSAWVEKGVPPPSSTNYKVVDGQVQVAATAEERKGIQPLITLLANGRTRAEVKVGQPVTLAAVITAPPQAGPVVAAEWSLEGAPEFTSAALGKPAARISLSTKHAFSRPGTYFPVLRAVSQRQGDVRIPFGRIQNLARVRVVVK